MLTDHTEVRYNQVKMATISKLTDEVRETIADALRKGNTIKCACALAGIAVETYYLWMHKGQAQERGEERRNGHHAFMQAVTRAEADAEDHFVGVLHTAASNDWRAAESWLKRRRREDFGDNIAVDVDAAIAHTLNALAGPMVQPPIDVQKEAAPAIPLISLEYIDGKPIPEDKD